MEEEINIHVYRIRIQLINAKKFVSEISLE